MMSSVFWTVLLMLYDALLSFVTCSRFTSCEDSSQRCSMSLKRPLSVSLLLLTFETSAIFARASSVIVWMSEFKMDLLLSALAAVSTRRECRSSRNASLERRGLLVLLPMRLMTSVIAVFLACLSNAPSIFPTSAPSNSLSVSLSLSLTHTHKAL